MTRRFFSRSTTRWALYAIFWFALGAVLYSFLNSPDVSVRGQGPRPPYRSLVALGTQLYLLGVLVPIPLLAVRYFPFRHDSRVRPLIVHLVAAIVFIVLHWLLMRLSFEMLFDFPPMGIGRGRGFGPRPENMRFMLFTSHAIVSMSAYCFLVGVSHAIDSARRLREQELHASRLAAELANAQLRALKDQLHPHFLFNTLNTLTSLIYEDVKAADAVIRSLSSLLRQALDNAGAQTVPLEEEIRFIDQYIEIMQARYPGRVHYSKDVLSSHLAISVPNLLLQPIVENCIKHGLEVTGQPISIQVSSELLGATLCIRVRDDGPGLSAENGRGSDGVGLRNTRERLKQLYGSDHRFEVSDNAGGGALVLIEVPVEPCE